MGRDRRLRRRNTFLGMEGQVKSWMSWYASGTANGYTEIYKKGVLKRKISPRKIVFF